MLSCEFDGDGGDVAWWYDSAGKIGPLTTKRTRKCCSCRGRIAVGDDCMKFRRWRTPNEDSVAYRIHGEEESLAAWYLCDRCAGLYESLSSLGFCNLLGQDLRDVCREYAQMQRDAGVFRGQMVFNAAPAQVTFGSIHPVDSLKQFIPDMNPEAENKRDLEQPVYHPEEGTDK
jgi:hypothetical protein